MIYINNLIDKLRSDEDGASMVEYGLLVALIALVAIAGVTALGTKLSKLFSDIADLLST
jgi:pilus assembly protein Flp/PilA